MKKIFMVICLLTALLLVSACAPQISDEELEAGLDTLSDEDLDAVIDESSKSKALAGQATAVERKYLPSLKGTVSRDRLLQSAQAVKIKRIEEKLATSIISPGEATPAVPAAIWDADHTSGSTVFDTVGDNDGAMFNGQQFANLLSPGKIGNAFGFTSPGHHVSIPADVQYGDPNIKLPTGAMTIAAWILTDTVSLDGSPVVSVIGPSGWLLSIMKPESSMGVPSYSNNPDEEDSPEITLIDISPSVLEKIVPAADYMIVFRHNNGAVNNIVITEKVLQKGVWQHLAATYDGAGNIKVYVDGAEAAIASQHSNPSSPGPSSFFITLGKYNHMFTPGSFTGKIDGVRVYDTFLSSAEIKSLYDSEK